MTRRLENQSVVLCFILIVTTVFTSAFSLAAEAEVQEKNIAFEWAFTALTGPVGYREIMPITRDTVLKSGDQLKMMIAFKSDCFIYLLYHGSAGELLSLFPPGTDDFQLGSQKGKRYDIPDGNNWFTLDENTGTEKFYLLASTAPLVELERLLRIYEQAPNSERPKISSQIFQHIKALRKKNRTLERVAERPIQIGGNFRSMSKSSTLPYDISKYAITISENTFFARTYTIEHK